jgi:uncharacterized protein
VEFQPQELKASILALLKLQEIDGILFRINEESTSPPLDFKNTESAMLAEQNSYRNAEKAFKEIDRERRGLELKNITLVEDLRKSETKRKEVRNTKEEFSANKEYENFQRRLQEMEKFLKEKEIIAQQKQQLMNDSKSRMEEAAKKLDELKTSRQARLQELSTERTQLVAQREAYISQVNGVIFSMYERVQKLRKGSGVAIVKAGNCTGCFVAIPPQQRSRLQLMQSLMTCPSCSRILCPEQLLNESSEPPLQQTSNA